MNISNSKSFSIKLLTSTKPVICQSCGDKSGNLQEYINHLEGYKHFCCKFCNNKYFTADELYYHFIDEHAIKKEKLFKCEKCKKKYVHLYHLYRHKRNKH